MRHTHAQACVGPLVNRFQLVLPLVATSLLLFSATGRAEVIHTDIPDVTLKYTDTENPGHHARTIDVNQDGMDDIEFTSLVDGWYHEWVWVWNPGSTARPRGTAAVAMASEFAMAFLNEGDVIGASSQFAGVPGGFGMGGGLDRYLGLCLALDDGPHYGYVHFSWTDEDFFHAITIHDYAFESAPNASITAGAVPEPAGLMALLPAALLVLRRRRQAVWS